MSLRLFAFFTFFNLLSACTAMQSATPRGLAKNEVRTVIQANASQIDRCYDRLHLRLPGYSGKVVVKFVIGASGQVASAGILGGTIHEVAMHECVVQAVQSWVFPKPRKISGVEVVHPFVFKEHRFPSRNVALSSLDGESSMSK